jgi:hypothetical protein
MDTGIHPANWGFSRTSFVEDKQRLTDRSKQLDEKGRQGLYEEHVRQYQHV